MKSLCVITIQLNTLTDVPYKMTVGGAFVYVCERDRVKDFLHMGLLVLTPLLPLDIMILTCRSVSVTKTNDFNRYQK